MAICIAHHCKHASNALPLPRKSALISASQPPARHSVNTARPRIRAGVSRDMPVYSLSFRQVLIPACTVTEGRLRLSRPGCLVPCCGGLLAQRWSPTYALTGPSVEQLCSSAGMCYHYVAATLNRQPNQCTTSAIIYVLCIKLGHNQNA